MRTRNQARNFGQDITNYESIRDGAFSSSRGSQKPAYTPNSIATNRGSREGRKKAKRLFEDAMMEDRIDEIMIFGYSYFERILGESQYIPILMNSCHCANNKICDHEVLSQSHHSTFPASPQLTLSMRNILVEWLVEVHNKMNLRYETLYLTIYLVDKFCSRRVVAKSEYQLLAMACLFIAGKYEQVATPKIKKIIGLCDRLYDCDDVLKMESEILLELNFQISQPSLNWFIGAQLFAISCHMDQQKEEMLAGLIEKFKRVCYYITQLCLFEIGMLKKYPPQVISNAIIYSTSMQSQFMGIDISQSSKHLSPQDLKQVRECLPQVRHAYEDRLNRKYDTVNNKYPDLLLVQDQ